MSHHVHIVPVVPPEFSGLGDYCYQLWKHWPEPRPEWTVLSKRVTAEGREHWSEVNLRSFELNQAGLLQELLREPADHVVLHYVGYAYARRGAPIWLPPALKAWKERSQGRLGVVFHELYATGPAWKSEFWTSPFQKRIVRQFVEIADRWITSCPRYERVLREAFKADPTRGRVVPVGSNIDLVDPQAERPCSKEGLRLAVFGFPLTRLRTLRHHAGVIQSLHDRGKLAGITMMGAAEKSVERAQEIADFRKLLPQVQWSEVIDASAGEISKSLSTHHVGLIHNPPDILGKSGVYAAYSLHGLAVLAAEGPGCREDHVVISSADRIEESVEALLKQVETAPRHPRIEYSFEHSASVIADHVIGGTG